MKAHWIWPLVLLLTAPAFAQEAIGPQPGSYALGGGAVYYEPGDGSGRWGPSALARYYFAERIAAEGSLDYRNESYPSDVSANTGALQLSLLGLLGTWNVFRLEPLAGFGYYVSRVDAASFHRNLGRFGGHLGIGLEAWPGKQKLWSVVVSYRHLFLPDLDTGSGQFKRSGEQLNFSLVRKFGPVSR